MGVVSGYGISLGTICKHLWPTSSVRKWRKVSGVDEGLTACALVAHLDAYMYIMRRAQNQSGLTPKNDISILKHHNNIIKLFSD